MYAHRYPSACIHPDHLDVIIAAVGDIFENRDQYSGMKLVKAGPITSLRHFVAGFELL